MKLVVIRHGEKQANAEGRYQGALDIGLNNDGVRNITRRWAEAPPGGETLDEVIARISQGVTELVSTMQGERILLVAHGVVAKVIRAVTIAGFDDFFAWQLPNGGMLVVNIDTSISPLRFNRPVGQS